MAGPGLAEAYGEDAVMSEDTLASKAWTRIQGPALPSALSSGTITMAPREEPEVLQKLWSSGRGECAHLFELDYFHCNLTPWRLVKCVEHMKMQTNQHDVGST